MITILKSKPESNSVYEKAKKNATIGTVFYLAGSVFIIYGILNPPEESEGALPGLISDKEMIKSLTPVFIGLGCYLVGVPFMLKGNKQIKESITIYNSKPNTGLNSNGRLDIGLTQYGAGITYHF